MMFPQVGFLTKNQNSELIEKVKRNLEEHEISYDIYNNAHECFQKTDFDRPPRIVLIDNETIELNSEIGYVMDHLNKLNIYCMVITENYDDKNFVKFLFCKGASDVRPKDHPRQIATSITTIYNRAQIQ